MPLRWKPQRPRGDLAKKPSRGMAGPGAMRPPAPRPCGRPRRQQVHGEHRHWWRKMGLNGRRERRRWGGRGAGPEQAGLAGPGLGREPSRVPLEPQVCRVCGFWGPSSILGAWPFILASSDTSGKRADTVQLQTNLISYSSPAGMFASSCLLPLGKMVSQERCEKRRRK